MNNIQISIPIYWGSNQSNERVPTKSIPYRTLKHMRGSYINMSPSPPLLLSQLLIEGDYEVWLKQHLVPHSTWQDPVWHGHYYLTRAHDVHVLGVVRLPRSWRDSVPLLYMEKHGACSLFKDIVHVMLSYDGCNRGI